MTKRTLEQALAHAEIVSSSCALAPRYCLNVASPSDWCAVCIAYNDGDKHTDADMVLLADEIKRLRLCSQCGCDHSKAYELGRSDERHVREGRDDRTMS